LQGVFFCVNILLALNILKGIIKMAVKKLHGNTIKVVAQCDSAVAVNDDVYQQYLQELDESLLDMKEEPTRFVVKLVLSYEQQTALDNDKMKMNGTDRTVQINSSLLPEARACLVGIEAPASQPAEDKLEFKKGNDGLADKDLISELNAAGICANLSTARAIALAKKSPVQKK
jgi:hypothetical protein